MGIMVYSLLWVMQVLFHQPYLGLGPVVYSSNVAQQFGAYMILGHLGPRG